MAEVTYYFDVYNPGYSWDNTPNSMADGSLETFAYTADDGDVQIFLDTTCPGTNLGTISKVELRAYGHGDGNDRIDLCPWGNPNVYPDRTQHQLTMPSEPGWSAYADITNDVEAPSPWTWGHIEDQNCSVEYDKVGKGNTMYCAKVEIRVTYPSGEGEKATQYLPGNNCPAFPHEMDLASDKLPCPPPYD